ncbi:hypothetical protein [Flexivirga alba]|uniref:DUF222 domain-containing protein n=1 Tax=Flexivirga alba TaxID=702742 RepID=A0ABW2AI77_9MICO
MADGLASSEEKARSLVLEAAQELTHGWPVQWHADGTEAPENNTVASREAGRPLRSAPTAQLAERTVLAFVNTEHYLDTATHYLEGAERGLAHRQEDRTPDVVDGWSTSVHDSIVQLANCHLSTLEDASTNLDRADAHLRDAYRDAMALAQSPHLTAQNHNHDIDTLTDTIEVTVVVAKARPPLEAAVALLRRDPPSVEQIGAAREQIGQALPILNHARNHAASADWWPDDGSQTHVDGEPCATARAASNGPQCQSRNGPVTPNAGRAMTARSRRCGFGRAHPPRGTP